MRKLQIPSSKEVANEISFDASFWDRALGEALEDGVITSELDRKSLREYELNLRAAKKAKPVEQVLPKDLLKFSRKVAPAQVNAEVAKAVEKIMPGFGSAVVTIDGKDYVAEKITFEHNQNNFVTGSLRFIGGMEPRRETI